VSTPSYRAQVEDACADTQFLLALLVRHQDASRRKASSIASIAVLNLLLVPGLLIWTPALSYVAETVDILAAVALLIVSATPFVTAFTAAERRVFDAIHQMEENTDWLRRWRFFCPNSTPCPLCMGVTQYSWWLLERVRKGEMILYLDKSKLR